MQAAVLAIRKSGLRPNKTYNLSLSDAARIFNVRRSTLHTRLAGVKPRKEAHVHERALSPEREEVLKTWAKVRTTLHLSSDSCMWHRATS